MRRVNRTMHIIQRIIKKHNNNTTFNYQKYYAYQNFLKENIENCKKIDILESVLNYRNP